ncbi:MAG TPA: DNA repair protein RecO [Candidatus Acidoferrales bacterium]|jgi:DNA repair protein RecO (recombination protein O)|nr:DNA repair protein RecO [Candidatus Acidoferrales bacterium]
MPLKESEAIVLRTFPLGEGDRLVSFLDRQSGRVRGVARGARLPKSRFGSTLEMLAYIRIWYFERETRELVRINQCELIESFMDVERDYSSAVALALVSEVTDSVLGEREAADAQFRLILLTARAVRVHGPSKVVLAYFCLWTARLGGWLGPLNRCSRCGRDMNLETGFHSAGFAEIYCADCRDDWMKYISKEALSIGRLALGGTLDRLLKENPTAGPTIEILSYALDVLEHHIEKKLISRKTFETGESGLVEI